jgi:hypothetical protein
MNDTANQDLVSAYIEFANAAEDSREYDTCFWASDELSTMCANQPREAWQTILAVLSRKPSSRVIELLAAGPLENLLVKHGPLLIDTIEQSAQRNGDIAVLLGGVWQSEIDPSVWKRVETARSRKW